MAISLDSSVVNATLNQQPRTPDSIKADQATGAFDLSSQHIRHQTSATNVQLSPFGQVKSSYADIQAAGLSLSAAGKSSTAEDTTKAVQAFAEAFNKAAGAINTATRSSTQSAALLANNALAGLTADDLKKIVPGANNAADLKKIGININRDGTLSVDARALQNAIQDNPAATRETLAGIGAQAQQVAGRELAGRRNDAAVSGPQGIAQQQARSNIAEYLRTLSL